MIYDYWFDIWKKFVPHKLLFIQRGKNTKRQSMVILSFELHNENDTRRLIKES